MGFLLLVNIAKRQASRSMGILAFFDYLIEKGRKKVE